MARDQARREHLAVLKYFLGPSFVLRPFSLGTVQDGVSKRCYGSSDRPRGMLIPLFYRVGICPTLIVLKGNINPGVPPMTEKENVFVHATSEDHSGSPSMDRDHDAKGASAYVGESSDLDDDSAMVQADPFEPFDDLPDERKRIITIRAVLLGCICGALVGSSNIYLGLKTGWTFGASLFGAIVGFAVIKPLSKALPEAFPIFGGSFGKHRYTITRLELTFSTLLA